MLLRSREFLVAALDATDVSERELARRAGLSHSTVNHLVTARRHSCSFATAMAIESELAIDPGVLFSPQSEHERRQLARLNRPRAYCPTG